MHKDEKVILESEKCEQESFLEKREITERYHKYKIKSYVYKLKKSLKKICFCNCYSNNNDI